MGMLWSSIARGRYGCSSLLAWALAFISMCAISSSQVKVYSKGYINKPFGVFAHENGEVYATLKVQLVLAIAVSLLLPPLCNHDY
jgi:hypothetical protein